MSKRNPDDSILSMLVEFVTQMRATTSRKDKLAILEKFKERDANVLHWIFVQVYDPRIQFYITSEQVKLKGKQLPANHALFKEAPSIWNVFKILSKRQVSGQAALDFWASWMSRFPDDHQAVLNCVLDKDLKCGLGVRTVNKVYWDSPIFDYVPALALDWEDQPLWKDEWYASRKLNGVRLNALIGLSQPADVQLVSRKGLLFFTLGEIEKVLLPLIGSGDHGTLDGEVSLRTPNGQDDFQGIMSQIRRINHTIKNPVFHVFDWIPKGGTKIPYVKRQKLLKQIVDKLDNPRIRLVQQIRIKSKAHLHRLIDSADRRKWEGLIARKNDVWKKDHTKDVLKIKKMKDMEARVIDITTREQTIVIDGRHVRRELMSAAIIAYHGNRVKVGSGWTLKQRHFYKRHPEKLIGKVITVQYFESTKNKKGESSLQFPVVKWVHGHKRTV